MTRHTSLSTAQVHRNLGQKHRIEADQIRFLNDWKWPQIPGLKTFRGELVHTANWDPMTDFKGKTVAVIGTGLSAIQAVPRIQKTAKDLTTFMRSVTWISPSIGADTLQEEKTGTDDKKDEKPSQEGAEPQE